MKILIVDDIEANLYLLKILLTNAGYEVVEAINGKLALDMADGVHVDLVVSDILMPVMDGFEFCKIWKTREKFKNIPFVFYTATYTEQKDREFALNLGADLFLVKPMESYNLLRELDKVIRHSDKPLAGKVNQPVFKEHEYYEEYSSILVKKLEAKVLQLEQKNHELMKRDLDRRQLNDSLKFQLSKVQLTEENLREHTKELLSIVNSMAEGVLTTDSHGKIHEFNPSAEAIFGYKRDEIVGKYIEKLMPEPMREAHKKQVDDFSSGSRDQLVARDMMGLRKDGTEIPIRLSVARLPIGDSKRELFICTFLDVSKERQQEEIIARSHKMEAIGTLSGGIAHDYNNMLGVIIGFTDLLIADVDDEEHREYLQHIRTAAERGSSLTRKLLQFSKREVAVAEAMNINQVIEDNLDMLKKLLTVQVEVNLDLGDKTPEIKINRNDFEDCILNLCINAMHAMPDGGNITIKTEAVYFDKYNEKNLQKGNYLHLSIEDTGCGMTDEIRERIFEPFFTTKGTKGTGLGLAQIYGFVQRSSGLISVSSELNVGTCFDIYFPETREGKVVEVDSKKNDPDSIIGIENTVLVVDDEPMLLELIATIIESFGCSVIKATNGVKALEKLSEQEVNLMISDVLMPGMNGDELVSTAKAQYQDLKAILMSGYNEMDDDSAHYLKKPFTKDQLLEFIINTDSLNTV